MAPVRPFFLPALALALVAAGCERPPSADNLPQWTPADHDRAEEQSSPARQAPQPGQGQPGPSQGKAAAGARTDNPEKGATRAPGSSPATRDAGAATLVEVTWETACAPCHGPVGHGDGPNGPMVNAPDITRDDLLSKISDEEIAAQIRNGKNRMPKFDLPDQVVQGLVARIRANRGR
jgi:hypothetical protein